MTTRTAGAALSALLSACQYALPAQTASVSGPFVGSVTLSWAPTATSVSANFTTPGSATDQSVGCPGRSLGSCCVYHQPQLDLSQGGDPPVTVSAGAISVAVSTGGNPLLGRFEFSGIGYPPLSSAETPTLVWSPGDSLEVSAAGGKIAAFSGSVVAPPAFLAVSPNLTTTAQTVVRVAADFTVSWTPPAADAGGSVTLELFDPVGFYVECAGPDFAGVLTVPAAALATFPVGDQGYVTLQRALSRPLAGADATVTLIAQTADVGLAAFR